MSCACPLEEQPQHESSPGVVQDDEHVLYVLVDPLHTKDGDLSGAMFRGSQLKAGELSVCRVRYATPELINDCVVTPLLSKEGRTFVGSLVAVAGEIRSITNEEGQQLYCVVDDPIHQDYKTPSRPSLKFPINHSHAHVGYSCITKVKNFWNNLNTEAAARENLAAVFKRLGGPQSVDYWFGDRVASSE